MSERGKHSHTLQDRRQHTLYTCSDPANFRAAFRREAGADLDEVVGEVACAERIAGVVLGGSIPLGIASAISDVDLILIIDDTDAIKGDSARSAVGPGLRGSLVGEPEALMAAEMFMFRNGIDVGVQCVVLQRVADMNRQLSRGNTWVSLSGQNTEILSRIKTGWVLSSTERFQTACAELLKGRALDIHCAVRYLVFALQDFEKAKFALLNDLAVALYLGRACVQECFCAYFASAGYPYLGNKWLTLLNRGVNAGSVATTAALGPLAERGLELLFQPLVKKTEEGATYLKSVAELTCGVKRVMERDTAIKVALKLSPQVYDPVGP